MLIEHLARGPGPLYRIFTDVRAGNKPGISDVHGNVGTGQTQKAW